MKIREARFSKIVEEASAAVRAAEWNLLAALQKNYPIDSLVRVVHHRGEYMGFVVGHDIFGNRIVIKNEETGKISRRWFREVESVEKSR